MATMRRVSWIGLFVALSLAFVVPAFPQGNDTKDWQSIQDQKDQKKKAEMLEAFLKKYATSSRRPAADMELVDLWVKNNNTGKILAHAEEYKKTPPSPDPAAKAKIFSQAMLVAYGDGNLAKAADFGNAALEADPTHFQSMYFMARAGLPTPEKAFEHAQKALALPKPANLAQETYARNTAQLHGIVAVPLFVQQKFAEARDHLEAVLKADPKNQEAQYRHGFASVNMMGAAAKAAQDANAAAIKARLESKIPEADVALAKQEASQKEALELRDVALESMARALAIGGNYSAQAKPLFDSLYQNKNNSMDGADQLIAQKKAELGIQ